MLARRLPNQLLLLTCFALSASISSLSFAQEDNQPPKGFSALFNGHDFDEWMGSITKNPKELAAMSKEERAEWDAKMKKGIHEHWHVDNGVLVSDGNPNFFLATPKDYGDFEMWVDWKIEKNGDSGIYLRGVPQVQIWDPTNAGEFKNGCDKGSGGLWNNKKHEQFPTEVADKPIGEWNRMYIRMVGPYVTVKLNGKKVVDDVILDNYYDPDSPLPMRGPLYLQTHTTKLYFRNVFVREIPADEANRDLAEIKGDHAEFKPVFNGKDLAGWQGATKTYSAVDGAIKCTGGTHGNLFTDDSYDNFVARLEFKLPPGGNNGLAIRAPMTQSDIAYEGMEVQVLDDTAAQYKDLHPYQHCGSLYGLAPSHTGYLRPVGDWNFEQVTVDGDRLTVELNGFEILNTKISEAAEKPMDGKKHPGAARKDGHFGFLGHQDPVEFRNISIKRLPAA
jgi:Domain of Unknown Function (DUF1080)